MNGFNEFKKQRLAELAKKDKGSATSALPAGVSHAIDATKAGQNSVSSFQVDDKKEKNEVITPNARNYDSFKDFKRDFLGAKAGIIEFKSGAYNHGVDLDYLTSLDKDIGDFFKEQDEALKNNPFGDTAASDAADAKIAEFKERLANVEKYRMENAKWLEKRELGNYRSPMEAARKATALASGEPITDFSKDMNATPGIKRDETLAAVDAFISGANAQLNYVEDAWRNAKDTYAMFGGDEAAYKDALMRSRHEYETYDDVKAALANPGRVSRMSAEELEYLSNYGLRHGYSDPAEYDKEIAELWDKIEFGGAEYGKGTEIGKELRSKIVSLEAARDALAENQAAWSSYTPFFNAEDFEAQSKYRGGGDLVTQYINAANDEERAELKKKLSTPHAESVDGGYKLSYSLPEDVVFTYDIMTEEEISMYNYLYNTQGKEAANVFLDTMSGLLKQRDRERDLAEITAWAQAHPINAIIGTGVSFLTNAGSALLAPGQLIANIVGAKDTAQDLGILADVTGSLRGGASQYIEEDLGLGGAGKVGYGVLTSVVDMLIARKAAGLTAGAGTQKLSAGLTQAIMSSEAASATMADANRRGLSGLQVAGLGVSSAAIEWLTEKYSIEALMSKPKTALRYWAKNVIAEGSEEAVAEIAGEMLDRVIAGDKSETMMRYHELVADGMDPKEASRKVLLDNLKDVGLAALTGALSGGIQAGPATISFKKSSLDNGRIIKDDGGEDILIREALKLGEGSEAYKLALAAQEKLSAKGELSSSTLGNIVLAGGEELVTAYEAAIEGKRGLSDYEAAVKKPVSEAEDAQEAFDDAEVREAAEREKAPIINLESNTAPLGNPNVRQQLDINEFSGESRAHMDSVMRLAEEFGQNVNFYAKVPSSGGKVENGFRNSSDGSININVYAKDPYSVVFGHELVHGTENAKRYSQLQTAVERYLNKEKGKGEFAKRANAIIESRKGTEWSVTLDGAYKEVVANVLSQELFQSENAVMRFVADNRTVGLRILEAIRSMLRKVTKGKAGYGSLKDAERLFAKALRQTEKAEAGRAKKGASASSAEKSDAYLIDGKKANAREISADLGRRLKAGEITSEDYDELFEKYVASSPEFRGEVEGELMGVMDSAEAVRDGVAQEKRFSISYDPVSDIDYVNISISDITGYDIKETDSIGRKARLYLKNRFKNTVLPLGKTKKAFIRQEGINEVTNPAKKIDDSDYRGKMLAMTELDNLLKSSKYLGWENDDGRHPDVIRWLKYQTTILFYDEAENSQVIQGEVKIKRIKKGDCFYDITQIKNITNDNIGQNIINNAAKSAGDAINSISQSPDSVNRQFSVSDNPVAEAARLQNEIFRLGVREKLVKGDPADNPAETLAAVEAQGRDLLDAYIESEPPAPVEHEYDEDDVNLPTTDYLSRRIVGYDSVRDALDALAKGRLSKEKGVELAKLIGMPELDGEVVVPFRTWVTLDNLPMYIRRDTGELVPVAGYALPSPNMMGLWVHYYDAQHQTHSNDFFTWDEITKTKAQHIPTEEELDAYNEWLDENSQLVPESTVPTAEEQQEINEKDHLFISEEESAHAEGVFEALPTRAKSYVNRALKGFKVRIADIFGVPYTRLTSSGIAEAGNAIVSDYLNNGGGFNEEKMDGIFEKLLDNLRSVDSSFYEQYQGVLRELREVKGLAISKDDASSIPGGLTAFNNRSNGRIGYVGLLENKRKKGSSFIPVDTFYQGMSEKYPELFPAEIVNPADQLERLLAEAKEIRASRNLAFELSKDERKYLLSEFRATLGTMTHPLSNAIRYKNEASEDGTAESFESAEDETRRFIKNGIKAQKLLPKIKKLEWQLLLSDHDKAVVGDLLSGYVTEDAVREREANAEEILTMYHARLPYEKLAREMKEYKKKVIKEQLRNAEEIVGDVSTWRDKEKFGNLRYNIIDFRRILRDIAPDEETAERAIRYYEEPIRRHSAEAVRYIQKMRDRVKALELSRKVRDGDAISESAAVQLLGEIRAAIDILEERMKNAKASAKGRDTMTRDGQTLEQWKKDEAEIWVMNKSFSDPDVKARIERGVEEFTKIYDEIHDSMNMALAKVGQQPIPKRAGYFPHFEKDIDMGFIAKARRLIGIGSEVSPLPTEIAGRTGDFRPNKEYFANAMKRMVNDREKQKETVLFDAVEGFDRYVEAAARQIYYTEDIVKLRSLDRYFRTAAGDDGIKTQIERIQNNGLPEAEQQILIDHIMKDARYQMSGFVQFLTEYTNKLAGKKSIVDRGIESLFGRDVFNISKAITKKYAINATSSLSSVLTNVLPWAQGSGGYSLRDFWLGAYQLLHGDGIVDDSVFATARQGSTRLVRSKLEKAGDWSRFLFEFVDRVVTTTTVQARYNYNIRRGLSNDAALSDADAWSAALIGDRSRAMQPLAFESHNPLVKVLTQFQLEVNNNILRTFKDIPRDLKTIIGENDTGTAALKITNYIMKTAIYTWVLNEVMERIVGRGPGGDFLGIIFDAIATGTGWDAFEEFLGLFGLDDEDEEEETGAWQAVAGTAYNITQEIPFVGGLFGGGRIPIASLFSDVPRLFNTFTDKEASWQYKTGVAFSELSTPLLYLTMPFGASQIKKSGTALVDWLRGGSYGYDKEGNELLKYPVAGGGDLLTGLLFGSTATEGGREWLESGFGNLGRKGTEAYKYAVAAGADEQEAWELVKKVNGLKSKDDPSEDASKIEQVAYLDSLDVDDEIKAGIYRGLIATEDKEGAVKDAEAELFDRCPELGITEGKLYRVLSDIRLLKEELREAGEEGTTTEVTEYLINAELLESAKPAVYSQIVSFSTFEKLYDGGAPKDQAEDVAYEIACLTPVGKHKSVTEVQKASVVLKSGLPEETAAQFIEKDTREKLSAVSEYGASVRGYVALKEYLLYNDEDGGAPSMEEAKKAINAISRGSVVSVPGMPDVALELTSSEKAALWQMMNSAWKPEKNPFSTSVGHKAYNALKALKEDEEE